MEPLVNYLRIWRRFTDTYITVNTPQEMKFEDAIIWAENEFPGFMVCTGCPTNPDNILDEL